MFEWDKSIRTIDVPAGRVVQLFRSMRDVQLALPGLPAQEASAYLCQHQVAQKVATTVAFHLLKSGQLAFYAAGPREVPADKAARMLDQALSFIESMGFLMTDLDIQLLDAADRDMLWSALPLQSGLAVGGDRPAPAVAKKGGRAPAATAEPAPAVPLQAESAPEPAGVPASSPAPSAPAPPSIDAAPSAAALVDEEPCSVDDLLAAVEALRTQRTGPRLRRRPPGREEVQRRRRALTANLGRILASL